MKKPWIKGTIFTSSLAVLIFFLKIICPLQTGCFADPFLIPMFSPLVILRFFKISAGAFEPFFILIFWAAAGGLAGFFIGNLFNLNKEKTEKLQ